MCGAGERQTQQPEPVPLGRVLVVEDDEIDLELTRSAFDELQLGDVLDVARDGDEALHYLQQAVRDSRVPSFVLLDVNMPRMNGFQLLEAIRAQAALQAMPVVVFSTSSRRIDEARALSLRAQAYAVKPFETEVLVGLVADWVRRWLK